MSDGENFAGSVIVNFEFEKDVTPEDRLKPLYSQRSTNYPRPQLKRKNWFCLNGEWKFCFDDKAEFKCPLEIKEWTHTIQVPYCPESKLSGIDDKTLHSVVWYERE